MPAPFPRWVPLLGGLFALAYLHTLAAPFDFLDDGNLVYADRTLDLGGRVRVWWEKVADNVRHLGPFRPAVWAHWELAANLNGTDPLAWRAGRMAWCGLAGGMLLWLLRELRLPAVPSLTATAAAMWNPYRNDIWTSLTLAEGVAMPYALFALVAARKAAGRGGWWDAASLLALLLALGCKNTFAALLPPMILLRTWGVGGWRAKGLLAALYGWPAVLPLAHLVYVKLNPGPNHYATPGPTWAHAADFFGWLRGAAGLDFLGVGVGVGVAVVGWRLRRDRRGRASGSAPASRVEPWRASPALPFALLLLLCGFAVYLPVNIMCGRYTMPAVWGADVLFAVLLASLPKSRCAVLPWAAVGVGLLALLVANVARQEKTAARSRLLWELLDRVEGTAPTGAVAEWVSGGEDGGLNAEEGIHFYWHLLYRGRADVRVRLVGANGQLVKRVELTPPPGAARFRLAAHPSDDARWQPAVGVSEPYHFGRKEHSACVQEAVPTSEEELLRRLSADDPTAKLLKPSNPAGPGVARKPDDTTPP